MVNRIGMWKNCIRQNVVAYELNKVEFAVPLKLQKTHGEGSVS